MFIQTEETPNPQTMKFIPGVCVMNEGTASYFSIVDAATSPLAEALFTINGVRGVFYGSDFITVTKSPEQEWPVLKPHILTSIMEHFVSGKPLIADNKPTASASPEDFDDKDADPEIVAQIKELIETRVRPAVAQDGGDIVYRGFKDGIVKLELHGACSGCPSSTATLKQGIESMLKHYVPEVASVEAIN